MTSFAELKTKKAKHEFVKQQIKTNDRWMLKGLLTIFERQTQDEQRASMVKEHNGVGFSRIDAEMMTSFANQLISKGGVRLLNCKEPIDASKIFSTKQLPLLRAKMVKYAGQLTRIAIEKQPKP